MLPRSVYRLLTAGEITLRQYGIFTALLAAADWKTGTLQRHLKALRLDIGFTSSADALRDDLHHLDAMGLIVVEVEERQRKPWLITIPSLVPVGTTDQSGGTSGGATAPMTAPRSAAAASLGLPQSLPGTPQSEDTANPDGETDHDESELRLGSSPKNEEGRPENVESRREQSCWNGLLLDDADASSSPDGDDQELPEEELRVQALQELVDDIKDADEGTFWVFDKLSRQLTSIDIREAHGDLERRRKPRRVDGKEREPLSSEAAFVNHLLQEYVRIRASRPYPGTRISAWLKSLGTGITLAPDFAADLEAEHFEHMRRTIADEQPADITEAVIRLIEEAGGVLEGLEPSEHLNEAHEPETRGDSPESLSFAAFLARERRSQAQLPTPNDA